MDCWPKALGRKQPVVWLQFISPARTPGRRHAAPRAPRLSRPGAGPGDCGRTRRRGGAGLRPRAVSSPAEKWWASPAWERASHCPGNVPASPELQNFKYTFDLWRLVSSLFLNTALEKQIALRQMMTKVKDERKANSGRELEGSLLEGIVVTLMGNKRVPGIAWTAELGSLSMYQDNWSHLSALVPNSYHLLLLSWANG